MPPEPSIETQSRQAHAARRLILEMSGRGGCFAGAALSCVDILVHLHAAELNTVPDSKGGRDYFLLSKGHAVPALYAVLAEQRKLDASRLERHLDGRDLIYWHPNPSVPGIDFCSGSLGHLPCIALGLAYDLRLRGSRRRAYVLMGDGELNEGSVWEALLVGSSLGLHNITLLIDRNRMQANQLTEQLAPLEPLRAKLTAFGWRVGEANGHDFDQIGDAFAHAATADGPHALVFHTTRGKGVPALENRLDKWFVKPSSSELESMLAELDANGAAQAEARK